MQKAKYKKNAILFHKEKNIFMMVDTYSNLNGNYYYRLRVLTNPGNEGDWETYYENKLDATCIEVNPKQLTTISLLYGG